MKPKRSYEKTHVTRNSKFSLYRLSQSVSGAANFGVSLHLSDERGQGDSFSNVVTVSPGVEFSCSL